MARSQTVIVFLVVLLSLAGGVAAADTIADPAEVATLRVASFNVSLYGQAAGELQARLAAGDDPQAMALAAIVQTVRPDILLVNEIDFDPNSSTTRLLANQYFAVGRDGLRGIEYPFVMAFATNTGVDSALDLNGNGRLKDPEDSWGYGVYPGQYAMAVFSRYPIQSDNLRTFQQMLWSDLPDALRPQFPDGSFYHSDSVWHSLRLSSKNHIDLPIQVGNHTLHLLASHPTPPVFDGLEDRNGCRNHDEILFWEHYLNQSDRLVDDQGKRGGLEPQASFVIVGDLNSDPATGDSRQQAIRMLLAHHRVQDPHPTWAGDTNVATADFGRTGQMRVDYVLPSHDLTVTAAHVFWPMDADRGANWLSASDHRLVWIDVEMPNP